MKKILVLMSTYNGERYLKEQVDSIIRQENVEVDILVRDDGSKDNTLKILEKYQNKGMIRYYKGENMGPAESFCDAVKYAKHLGGQYDFYAFADQDDVWDEKKLFVAVQCLKNMDEKYLLYTSALNVVNSNLQFQYKQDASQYEYPELLLRNMCAGCTMVFNKATFELLSKYCPNYLEMHDVWLLRLVASSLSGRIYYDSHSYINYRQHEKNVVGSNKGFSKALKIKIKQLFNKKRNVSRTAQELMSGYEPELSEEAKELLDLLGNYYCNFSAKKKLLLYYKKVNFSSKLRKLFFIWDVLYGNL